MGKNNNMSVIINVKDSITLAVDERLLKKAIQMTLESVDRTDADVTLQLTDNEEMRQINLTYREIDHTTDVLSFNQDYVDPETQRYYLGDILISVEQAQSQAQDNNHSLSEECAFLAIHGTLHLLGYDHSNQPEKEEMCEKQDKLFRALFTTNQEQSQ
jgi:probable rRNA maturation factor